MLPPPIVAIWPAKQISPCGLAEGTRNEPRSRLPVPACIPEDHQATHLYKNLNMHLRALDNAWFQFILE